MNPYSNYRQRVACPNGQIYIIRAGDTIYRLALRYNVSVEAILQANPGINPDRLFIGQQICIPVQISCPGGQIYIVKPGDNLYKLAQMFRVKLDAIINANPGIDPDNLYIGQKICIPKSSTTPPTTPSCSGQLYTIKAGDTYYKLAQKFSVSVNEIIKANPGVNPNALQIGQIICIPKVEIDCPSNNIYIVKPGDSLYKLAKEFNVSMEALLASNPQITNPNVLVVGQQICVPSPMASEPFDGQLDRSHGPAEQDQINDLKPEPVREEEPQPEEPEEQEESEENNE